MHKLFITRRGGEVGILESQFLEVIVLHLPLNEAVLKIFNYYFYVKQVAEVL